MTNSPYGPGILRLTGYMINRSAKDKPVLYMGWYFLAGFKLINRLGKTHPRKGMKIDLKRPIFVP